MESELLWLSMTIDRFCMELGEWSNFFLGFGMLIHHQIGLRITISSGANGQHRGSQNDCQEESTLPRMPLPLFGDILSVLEKHLFS